MISRKLTEILEAQEESPGAEAAAVLAALGSKAEECQIRPWQVFDALASQRQGIDAFTLLLKALAMLSRVLGAAGVLAILLAGVYQTYQAVTGGIRLAETLVGKALAAMASAFPGFHLFKAASEGWRALRGGSLIDDSVRDRAPEENGLVLFDQAGATDIEGERGYMRWLLGQLELIVPYGVVSRLLTGFGNLAQELPAAQRAPTSTSGVNTAFRASTPPISTPTSTSTGNKWLNAIQKIAEIAANVYGSGGQTTNVLSTLSGLLRTGVTSFDSDARLPAPVVVVPAQALAVFAQHLVDAGLTEDEVAKAWASAVAPNEGGNVANSFIAQ